MNANELAQQLSQMDTLQEVMSKFEYSIIQNSATMLLHQQAEIEALKYEKYSGVYDLAKTLTDEDCECLEGLMGMYWDVAFKEGSQGINLSEQANDVLNSFRAILKKASEK